jgi:hypothetical protein
VIDFTASFSKLSDDVYVEAIQEAAATTTDPPPTLRNATSSQNSKSASRGRASSGRTPTRSSNATGRRTERSATLSWPLHGALALRRGATYEQAARTLRSLSWG